MPTIAKVKCPTNKEAEETYEQACKNGAECLWAIIYLKGAHPKKSAELLEDMSNDYAMGNKKYPATLDLAIEVLDNFKPQKAKDKSGGGKQKQKESGGDSGSSKGTALNQQGRRPPNPNIKCFRCGGIGHIAPNCEAPHPKRKGTSNAQTSDETNGATNATSSESNNNQGASANDGNTTTGTNSTTVGVRFCPQTGIQLHMYGMSMQATVEYEDLTDKLLLDSQSTCHIFCRPDVLENVRTSDEIMALRTNAGVLDIKTVGDVPGFGTVWCDKRAITNILSLGQVEKSGSHEVTYNKQAFYMRNLKTGRITVFKLQPSGLYVAPLFSKMERKGQTAGVGAVNRSAVLINTVAENEALFLLDLNFG